MKDLRGPLPLTDADFARIRANVRERVRPRRTLFAFRWALAMLAAASAGVIAYRSLQAPPAPPHRTVAAAPSTATNGVVAIAPSPTPAVVPSVATARIAAHSPVRRASRPRHTARPEIESQPVRIEIQTADPDIRIIWLPNHDPQSEETK